MVSIIAIGKLADSLSPLCYQPVLSGAFKISSSSVFFNFILCEFILIALVLGFIVASETEKSCL